MGAYQDLQNLIKAINAFRTGTILPEELKKACSDLNVAAFTNELRRIIERDGCEFVGAVKDCGVTFDTCCLTGPLTRDLPSQYNAEGNERLTVTCADVGAQVEFMNFYNIFQTRTVFRTINWDSVLCWILSCYKGADMLVMCELMKKIPSGQGGIGSKANCTKVFKTIQ